MRAVPLLRLLLGIGVCALAGAAGCSSESDAAPTASPYYVQIIGKQSRRFDLAEGKLAVKCRPDTKFKQFEFEAATDPAKDLGDYVRFVVAGYDGPGKEYAAVYGVANQPHTVQVGFDRAATGGGYRYEYGASRRTSRGKDIGSRCNFFIESDGGVVTCTLLWAEQGSKDHIPRSAGKLNNFIDLIMRFQCPTTGSTGDGGAPG